MTIKNIRKLQVACQSLLMLAAFLIAYLVLLMTLGSTHLADIISIFAIASLLMGLLLLLVIRKLRCPVCRTIYVGRRSPRYFTRSCSNCGRRAGDTA